MADDMGFGDVGCYNPDSKIPTPHMDKASAQGVRFTDAHSPSAVCTPTRYGVLTGRYCWRSRLKKSVLGGYSAPLVEPDRLTIAGMLKSAGYHTACIGKWHLGLSYRNKSGELLQESKEIPERDFEAMIDFEQPVSGGPTDVGFDYFFGTSGCSTCNSPYAFVENDRFVAVPSDYYEKPVHTSRPGAMVPGWEHKDVDPTFAGKAVEYIKSRAETDEPFFLYLTPPAPHEPCMESVVPEFARGKSEAGPRGDLVWLFDWVVGRVMTALEEAGVAEDTMLVITSDNGALPGDRVEGKPEDLSYSTYGHKSCGDWRGYKAHIWEGGHREPFIIRYPGVVEPDSVVDDLTGLTDFYATCAQLLKIELPADAAPDSISFLPAITGGGTSRPARTDIIHHSVYGVFSIREGKWKLIVETKTSGGWPPPRGKGPVPGEPGQLYNIEEDPAEENDLFDEMPGEVRRLTRLLESYQNQEAPLG